MPELTPLPPDYAAWLAIPKIVQQSVGQLTASSVDNHFEHILDMVEMVRESISQCYCSKGWGDE